MKRITQIAGLALLFMMALAIVPRGAWAQTTSAPSSFVAVQAARTSDEYVTVQIDGATPTGVHIVGTLVVRRTLSTGEANLSFNGTVEGQPASASAIASETWAGTGKDELNVTSITSWNAPVPQPSLMNVHLSQVGPGLLTINGIPMATSAELLPPGSGNQTYVVTNPGVGEDSVAFLPQTGSGGAMLDPLMIAMFLVTIGPLLVVVGIVISKISKGRRWTAQAGTR
ncbi:MAG: hypothetical protein ABJA50_14100 [Chloroflexota bacterium]